MAEGRAFRDADPEVTIDVAHPDFFKTIGARLIAGRDFNAADRDSAQPVAIINEHMAKYYWPGASAIGKRFLFGGANTDSTQSPWITVVGVVADMRRTGVDMPVRNESFLPFAQSPSLGNLVVIKSARDPMSLVPSVRAAMRALDPNQPSVEHSHDGRDDVAPRRAAAVQCDARRVVRGTGARSRDDRRVRRDVVSRRATDEGDRCPSCARRGSGPSPAWSCSTE